MSNASSKVRLSGRLSLQSTLRISPPLPYLASNMQKDLLRLGSRLDPQDSSSPLTPPSSASPASSAISRRWRSGSPWPGADMLDQSDDAFSIEREARLHRQAAGKTKTFKSDSSTVMPFLIVLKLGFNGIYMVAL